MDAPEGWKQDPAQPASLLRWWDGTAWTDHTVPIPPPPPPPDTGTPHEVVRAFGRRNVVVPLVVFLVMAFAAGVLSDASLVTAPGFAAFGSFVALLGWDARPYEPAGWTRFTGTIIDLVVAHPSTRRRGSPTVYAVVSYRDNAGVDRRVQARTATSHPDEVGSQLTVAYDPLDPASATIIDGRAAAGWRYVVAFGLVFLAVSLAIVAGATW